MAKPEQIAEFKRVFGDAPELTEPFKTREHSLPLKLVDFHREGSYPLATFEGVSPIEDENTLKVRKVRVDYAGSLRSRREQVFTKPGANFVLNYANVRYNTGPVDIVYLAGGPIIVNPFGGDERDWSLFSRQILVQLTGKQGTPLAQVEYFNSNGSIQYELFLTYGEFGDLIAASKVQSGEKDKLGLRAGRADIGTLSGVHIQETSIVDGRIKSETPVKQSFVNGVWTDLDNTPYQYQVSYDRDRQEWGRGRLRFSRVHSGTRSSCMLSVPEWLNSDRFMECMVGKQWYEILMNHPVRFAVEDSGQPRQWFSTFGEDDKPF